MGELSYWAYRWARSAPKEHQQWRVYVQADSAFLARRKAGVALQRQHNPSEPIDPLHVEVQEIGLVTHWCVQHDNGWCALPLNLSKTKAQELLNDYNAPTLCGYYVHDPEHVVVRVPDCELCITKLLEGELPLEV